MDGEGVEKIDFLSMESNGGEPTALRGFDGKRFPPGLVHVVVHAYLREVLADEFEKNDYKRVDKYHWHDLVNWYITPKK